MTVVTSAGPSSRRTACHPVPGARSLMELTRSGGGLDALPICNDWSARDL
ncbi:hypothetical protein [Streptomyces sp. MA5143a]|nr:hypothetical protein [Streptomyces sp. MA5143a]